jgi:hypothetical protein
LPTIWHPNGLAITSAHEVLVAETLGNRVIAFQMGNDGALLHRRVFANFERMSPLGICADSEVRFGRPPPDSRFLSACYKVAASLIGSTCRAAMRSRVNWAAGTAERSFV